MSARLTILMAARDASATIERAMASCVAEPDCQLILIDDHCTDDTVAKARAIAGARLRVLQAPDPGGIPIARQAGLDAIETELATWVDADDEWVPGRAERMIRMLDSGVDVSVDAFDLYDGATGERLRHLPIPQFLQWRGGALRLFERNWLPGDSPVGFRTEVFRKAGGYDPAVYGPESYDLLLRALMQGARFGWSPEVGYRIYAYPGSVSRNVERQRKAVATALKKHDYEDVRQRMQAAGYSPRVAAWSLVSMALFRQEFGPALRFIDEASPVDANPLEVLEADGPWPYREGWRRAFVRGTSLLLFGGRDLQALQELKLAEAMESTPEGANNLGIALARLGRVADAQRLWQAACDGYPGYADPRSNLTRPIADHITALPLRRLAARIDYAA